MITKFALRRSPGFWFAALILAGACTAGVDKILVSSPTHLSNDVVNNPSTGLVISQVYGGGGNSGASYKNDYIELYNGTSADIALTGYSVQYASAAGASWQVTPLSGTLVSGHYYLVQEAAGAGGSVNLPTPDATGAINMSATAGKVALVNGTGALSGSGCPFGSSTVDFVGFGSTANCFEGSPNGPTATLTNTTAALRRDSGRQDSNNNSSDFQTAAPAPRNSASPATPPLNELTVTISPSSPSVSNGATVNFTATASRGSQNVAISSATWTSSAPAVATIDASTGIATAVSNGSTTIGVAVTTANGNASSSTVLTVAAAAATVTVSPSTWSLRSGQTKQFSATATDAGGNPVTVSYSWTSSNAAIATVDASGIVTGHSVGSATITATTPNGVSGTGTVTVTAGNVSLQSRPNALPVGFQTQVFVNTGATDSNGQPVTSSNVTWSSSNPGTLSVNSATGVVTARAAGSTVITATANSDGVSSGSTTIVTDVEPTSAAARVGHNTELGTPTDANPSDDIIIARRNYTISYNVSHGGPNWVSWNLDASHIGSAPRCNCFTADTALTRMGYPAYDTNDWVNGGVWSRGHMSPSADWADTTGDNAPTYFLSNMLPQNQTANAGAWGDLENYLRTRATGSTEIYIIAGGIFTRNRSGAGVDGFGFMNSTGHIAVPDSMWKIAVIVPDGRSASQITSPSDVQVIAVNMANESGSTGSYTNFATTIDRIQRSTGYDMLSALPEAIQCRLEVRNCAPVATIAAVNGASEGTPVTLDASASTDADGDALTYSWTFGDGTGGSGPTPSHTYADNGSYTVSVTVSDGRGGSSTFSRSVAVSNVAPVPTMNPTSTTVAVGAAFNPQARFTDAGVKDATWRAVFSWGDGTSLSTSQLTQPATPIRASKSYSAPGTYVVRFTVTDKDGGSAYVERTVTVTP